MKVIFDSEEEKKNFMKEVGFRTCPRQWGFEEKQRCKPPIDCEECWEKAVGMEVKK